MTAIHSTHRSTDHHLGRPLDRDTAVVSRPAGAHQSVRMPGRRPATRHVVPIRLMVLLIAVAGAFLAFSLRVEAGAPEVVEHVTVERGDSLWELAATVTGPGEDVRAMIHRIIEMNGLESSTIHPGQQLVLPGS